MTLDWSCANRVVGDPTWSSSKTCLDGTELKTGAFNGPGLDVAAVIPSTASSGTFNAGRLRSNAGVDDATAARRSREGVSCIGAKAFDLVSRPA